MSIQDNVIFWLQRMGYDGPIPEILGNICNESTSAIWSQLIATVRPKDEVQHCHKNIIINRLNNKNLDGQAPNSYPIKEIEIYHKKKLLEAKKQYLEQCKDEKLAEINKLQERNKLKYFKLANLQQKVKENKEKAYLLRSKSGRLRDEISVVKDLRQLARDVTPIETIEESDNKRVTETLQKCSEKLQKLLQTTTKNSNSQQPPPTDSTFLLTSSSSLQLNSFLISTTKKFNFEKSAICSTARKTVCKQIVFPQSTDFKLKKTNRESLGLLPDSILNSFNEFDNEMLLTLNCPEQSAIETDCYSLLPESQQYDNNSEKFLFDTILNDKQSGNDLSSLFCTVNANLIWQKLDCEHDELFSCLENCFLENLNSMVKSSSGDEGDMSELYYIHIKTEMELQKCLKEKKRLKELVAKQYLNVKHYIQERSLTGNYADTALQLLDLQLEAARLDATVNYFKQPEDKTDTALKLERKFTKFQQINHEIATKYKTIQNYMENWTRLLRCSNEFVEETLSCHCKLNNFLVNTAWVEPLNEPVSNTELVVFSQFPLEYNRKITIINGRQQYVRDLPSTVLPTYVSLKPDELTMVHSLNSTPWLPVETSLINFLNAKIRLQNLKEIRDSCPGPFTSRVNVPTVEELMSREDYIGDIANDMDSINDNVNSTSRVVSVIKRNTENWLSMPFKDYLSDTRTFQGFNYKYYQDKLDKLLEK